VGIVVLVAVVGGVVLVTDGDDEEEDDAPGPTSGSGGGNDDDDLALTFSEAQEQGIEVDWPDTCDTETGRVAIPSNFAAECVAPWEGGDNGGATADGVTADTIRIVYYVSPDDPFIDQILAAIGADDTDEETLATLEGFVDLYSAYYELYGREIELIPFPGTASSIDEVAARADAAQIDEELDPFMVWGGPFLTDAFSDELASRGIVNLSIGASMRGDYYAERGPSLWSVLMTPDQLQTHLAAYLGRRLAGRPAQFAGDEEMRDDERVFGRFYLEVGPDVDYLVDQFDEAMAAEGTEFAVSVPYAEPITLASFAPQKIAEMREAGVTTVVCMCDPLAPADFTEEATRQGWFPEWIVTGSNVIDTTVFARTYDQEQWSHAFGPSSLFARGLPESSYAYYLYEWYRGEPPPADTGVGVLFPFPTTLFTGLQGAGPNLTPESYRDALFEAPPVPPGLTNPQVSFGEKGYWPFADYTALDDMTEVWWDPGAAGPDERGEEGTGMYRYVDGGVRYGPDDWPSTEPRVFDPENTVTFYEELPDSDAVGDYPSPAD
jgi:hypothetical protein